MYLVGFMGAGKSTVARALAKRLHWTAEDIDERIEKRERRDIPTIFRQDGEPYFRSIEQEELIALLQVRGAVVATGGGTIVNPIAREMMLRDGAVIWLDAPFAIVLDRVPLDGGGRWPQIGLKWKASIISGSWPTAARISDLTPGRALWRTSWIRSSIGSEPRRDALPRSQ